MRMVITLEPIVRVESVTDNETFTVSVVSRITTNEESGVAELVGKKSTRRISGV